MKVCYRRIGFMLLYNFIIIVLDLCSCIVEECF